MTPSSPAIETAGLAKRYGDNAALAPIDLVVPLGQRVSLIGHNGSGKTTLIKLLAGLLDPSDGTATICGHSTGTPMLGLRSRISPTSRCSTTTSPFDSISSTWRGCTTPRGGRTRPTG